MDYKTIGDYKISRVGLGTVQFGMDYGINNKTGQVGFEEIVEILTSARDAGLNFVDTAPAYGTSEESIGKALAQIDGFGDYVICTKLDLPSNVEELGDKELTDLVRSRVARSIESLRIECVPLFLLHRPAHRTMRNGLVWKALLEECSAGRIGHLGVSVDGANTEDALECIGDGDVTAVQIPFNALDYRWHAAGVFEAAKRSGTAIISRSTYLKGLLAMDVEDVPEFLSEAVPHKEFLATLASDLGITSIQFAMRYVLSLPEIASTIVGVDSAEQFRENLDVYRMGPLPEDVVKRIQARIRDVSDLVVVPSLWNEYMELEKYEDDEV